MGAFFQLKAKKVPGIRQSDVAEMIIGQKIAALKVAYRWRFSMEKKEFYNHFKVCGMYI